MSVAPKRVRKRDGREVPFDVRKIADAIDKAIRASGREDRPLADELASAVALSLARRGGPAGDVPAIEEIQDLVERVLIETGHAAVAKVYILYRDKRARVREALAVHHPRSARAAADAPRAASSHRSEPWSKGKIVAALMMEAELPRELAEEIASSVEKRVFESGFTRVSTGLLRELVDTELFARGLEAKLRQQTVVGLPKYDLREGLRSGFFVDQGELVAPSRPPESTIARALLSKFAVEDVLPARLADRHLAGDLHFDGLESPHRDVAAALSLRGIAERAFPALASLPAPRDLEETLDLARHLVARARRAVAGTLALYDLDALATGPARGAAKRARGAKPEEIAARCVRALALGNGDDETALVVDATSPLAPHFVAEAAAFADRALAPSVVLAPRAEGVAQAPSSPPDRARLAFASAEERALAPGVHMHREDAGARFVSTGAFAVLNLPRLAYAAESYREGRLLESLMPLVDDAVEGLAAMREALAQTAVSRGVDLPAPRRSFGLAFVGLRECVRAMCAGAVDARLARSIVQAVVERSRAAAAARRLRVFVEPWFASRARGRFERLDAERCPGARAFHDGDRVRYSEGATLSPVPGLEVGSAEGETLAGVAAGVLPPSRDAEESAAFAAAFTRARGELRAAPARGNARKHRSEPPRSRSQRSRETERS